MSIALAAAWYPRGEMGRFQKLLPQLQDVYERVVISVPPEVDENLVEALSDLEQVVVEVTPKWSWGRYLALQKALEVSHASHIHYADFDRLLRWVEIYPEEWRRTLARISQSDYLLVGRTDAAYGTHPKALVHTEAVSNRVVSYLVGQPLDVSAGSKGFSHRAAEFLVANTRPGYALGTDAEWTVLLKRAGFCVDYLQVDGLDWESADRYQDQAADIQRQRSAAEAYDADPASWERRVQVAMEVVESGLDASQRLIKALSDVSETKPGTELSDFDFEAVFSVEDYLYFYRDSLTDERTQAEVDFLVEALSLDEKAKILDLACGFGRHANGLAALGHVVTGVDLTSGFLEIARRNAGIQGLRVTYQQDDMRQIEYEAEFDCVLCLFTSFGYFSDHENLEVIKNVVRALKVGGLFCLDIPNRDHFLQRVQGDRVTEKDGNLMIDRSSFDPLSGRWYNRRIVIRDGVRKNKPFFIRLYNLNEIRTLIEKSGMQIIKIFGSWDAEPLTADSRRMIIIAKR